jgi:Holliday junction DNA helicase RuvA
MIAKLTGRLDQVSQDSAIIDVSGVGYLVFGSNRTLGELPEPGDAVSLVIETHVREDHIHLYGFADESERNWFRALISVQGVGAKVALAILSVADSNLLGQAIAAQDPAPFTQASGVGPKLAKRIIIELKDRAPTLMLGPSAPGSMAGGFDDTVGAATRDAVSALVNLGYQRTDAFTAISTAAQGLSDGAAVEELIKGGLTELGR